MNIVGGKITIFLSIVGLCLWITLPLASGATLNAKLFQMGYGYAPVASLRSHPNPPKDDTRPYTQLVWRHGSFTVLWLPFWGTKSGEYGLYRSYRTREYSVIRQETRRKTRIRFAPLSFDEASKLANEVGVSITPEPPISTWSLYFGWVVLCPFGLLLLLDRGFYRRVWDSI